MSIYGSVFHVSAGLLPCPKCSIARAYVLADHGLHSCIGRSGRDPAGRYYPSVGDIAEVCQQDDQLEKGAKVKQQEIGIALHCCPSLLKAQHVVRTPLAQRDASAASLLNQSSYFGCSKVKIRHAWFGG